jgi:hypothetical protein
MVATVAGMFALLTAAAAGGAGPVLAAPGIGAAASVPSPGQSGMLTAVAAVVPGDAWAVGSYCPSRCTSFPAPQRYMIQHWNGKTWALALTGPSGTLQGVSAAGAGDIWAAGSSAGTPLFLHWNGKTWSRGKATAFPPAAGIASVSTLSPSSAWAVGSAYSPKTGAYITLVAHWNGSKWSPVPAPPLAGRGSQAQLTTVSADSANDAWAAGNYCASACSSRQPVYRGAILHWNGSRWSRSPLPVPNSFDFFAVTALSRSDAWAVGQTVTGGFNAHPLMLHWNGSRWLQVAIPNDYPSAMTFVSPSDGWAVGLGTPVLHWNGTAWTQGPPATPNWGGFVNGASGDAANDVWVVGDRCTTTTCTGNITRGFILHWNGSKWSML